MFHLFFHRVLLAVLLSSLSPFFSKGTTPLFGGLGSSLVGELTPKKETETKRKKNGTAQNKTEQNRTRHSAAAAAAAAAAAVQRVTLLLTQRTGYFRFFPFATGSATYHSSREEEENSKKKKKKNREKGQAKQSIASRVKTEAWVTAARVSCPSRQL